MLLFSCPSPAKERNILWCHHISRLFEFLLLCVYFYHRVGLEMNPNKMHGSYICVIGSLSLLIDESLLPQFSTGNSLVKETG